jgi:hypothetical protein
MHKKYAKDGLMAVSVALDDVKDMKVRDRLIKFLTAQGAGFSNFMLDESDDLWREKLNISGPPCIYVFNRQGQWVKKYESDVDFREIEKVVVELLKQ